jgi:hypothetical protein
MVDRFMTVAKSCGRAKGIEIAMMIRVGKLTTCGVAPDGSFIELEFVDVSDAKVTVQLPIEHAGGLVMTLPELLSRAVRQNTCDQQARYVFDLGEWAIESVKDQRCLLATLKTTDGFEVCFGIPFEACRSLAQSLQHGADTDHEVTVTSGEKPMPGDTPARLN